MTASFLREHLEVVGRPAVGRRLHAHALIVLGDHHAEPGVAKQVLADEVRVTAIVTNGVSFLHTRREY
jgi:ethanolamine ammonia-lyase small subunit